jgi:hypothetical protein
MRANGSAIRREQVRILLAALPAVVVAYLIAGLVGSFSERPWFVALALLPVGLTVAVLGWPLVRHRRLLLGGGFLGFFVAYCLFFSIAAATRVLDGRRAALAGFEAESPSNVLRLSRVGDWHYLFARAAPPANDILVITLPSFERRPVEEARQAQAALIRIALEREAKGIAFDYHVEQTSNADRILCFWIDRAERARVPVVYGYRVKFDGGTESIQPMAPTLASCIAKERRGALTGLREADGFVRMVPTSHARDTLLRSFSYRIATVLAGGGLLSDMGLTQYVRPSAGPIVIEGTPDSADLELFRARFVLVGSFQPSDVHATPYGRIPGVLIHAFAAHGLRAHHYIRRLDALWLLPGIVLLCYLLTLLQARGGGIRPLLAAAAILSIAVATAAAIAVRAGLVWIDASYPLVAIWGLTGILSGGAVLQQGRLRARVADVAGRSIEAPDASAVVVPEAFDVFLSHNSKDDDVVRELGSALRARQLRVWLDEWELVPGRPWQEAVEQAIATTRSAAVLVGVAGLGPWEVSEMRACLELCVERHMPVIPVLLPGAPVKPTLPLFLRRFTWVDLREGLSEAGLDRLQWGITGIKPHHRPPSR